MSQSAPLMAGKKGLVMGVANDRSLAWGITRALHESGAEIAFTYQNEILAKRVQPLAEKVNSSLLLECDVGEPGSIARVMTDLAKTWDSIDFLVHAVAFSDKNELTGRYIDTTAANFAQTMAISCYSFTELCQAAAPLMKNGGSIVTLTYAGSERVVPHYNVMGVAKAALESSVRYLASDLGPQGIRVNAISAGPIKTLSAMGVSGISSLMDVIVQRAPLRRNITQEDVGNTALWLLSEMSSGVTGQTIYVDAGYSIMGA